MEILYLVMNPMSIMKVSRRLSPSSLKMPDRIGASFMSSKGPLKSRRNSPTPEPSWPSRMTFSASMATMGDRGSLLVMANNRHMGLSLI